MALTVTVSTVTVTCHSRPRTGPGDRRALACPGRGPSQLLHCHGSGGTGISGHVLPAARYRDSDLQSRPRASPARAWVRPRPHWQLRGTEPECQCRRGGRGRRQQAPGRGRAPEAPTE